MSVLRKAGGLFLRVNEWAWNRVPADSRKTRPVTRYGAFLHSLVKLRSDRRQYHGTFFLRNRAELQLLRTVAEKKPRGSTLRIAVLACSNGAEVYSIVWTVRSARPDLEVITNASDISSDIVGIARRGIYSSKDDTLVGSPIFERLTDQEIESIFEPVGEDRKIQAWIQEGIQWQVADATDEQLVSVLGGQDIVVANKFLCHMDPPAAESCLRNLARLVVPGGYLFVSGIDLDVRTKVARELGWLPVLDSIEEIHDGDPSVRKDWPWRYWGLEPFDRKRSDWAIHYASVFRLGQPTAAPDVAANADVFASVNPAT